MRGCVNPQEKSDIVPRLSGFLKRVQDLISSHGGVALMSEPQPITGKRIWLESHVVRSGVDTGGHRYCSRVFGAVEIRGIHESAMGPYFPRVRRKCPPLMGLYPPRTALWSSNPISDSPTGLGFSPRAGWCRPEKAPFASPVDGNFGDVERPLDRGWDPISSRGEAGSTCEPWPIRKSVGRPGLGFPHRAGRYHVWMDSDPGM